MTNDFKGGPWISGWIMAAMTGLIAFVAALLVGKFGFVPSVAIAGVVFLLTGLVMDWAGGPLANPVSNQPDVPSGAAPDVAPMPVVPVLLHVEPVPATAHPAPVQGSVGTARKPATLAAARDGSGDDLKIIKGIGAKLELMCHKLGFYHFDQIAGWTADEIAWVDANLEGFKGRVTRDRWVPQARAIVEMGPQAFLDRLDRGTAF